MSSVVGRPYAEALLQGASDLEETRSLLAALEVAVEVLGSEPARRALGNPAIAPADQAAVLRDLIKEMDLPETLARFVEVLFEAGRLYALGEIRVAFEAMFQERFEVRRAEIRAAAPLEDAELDRLTRKLEELTGGRVEVEFVEDPELVAGWRARVGNYLIEADLRSRLSRVRECLVKG